MIVVNYFRLQVPPPLSLAPFVGCIELASLNNDVISLYNFKQTHKMDVITSAPCPRYSIYAHGLADFGYARECIIDSCITQQSF